MTSTVSVVIPVHDRATLLPRALASVAGQTTAPAETIVIDDGSTDGSAEVAERLGVRVIRQPNGGVSAARNHGLRVATGTRVAFLDSDDEWLPDHLATLATAGRAVFTSTAALTTRGALIGSQRATPVTVRRADRLLWPDNPVVTSAVAVDRAAALAVGGFDETMAHSEDLDLWARLLARGPGIVLPTVTVRYWVHEAQASIDVEAMRAGENRLVERGLVTPRTARLVAIRDDWDRMRATGGTDLRALVRFLPPERAGALVALLAHRARGRRVARRAQEA